MRQDVKAVLLAVLMGSGCIGDSCDCNPEAAAGCSTDGVTGGTEVPAAPANRPPVISGLNADPVTLAGRERPSHIQATVTDQDGDTVSWTLALDGASNATGVFSQTAGTGNIDSTFRGTRGGSAVIRATATDGRGGTVSATVTVMVTGL